MAKHMAKCPICGQIFDTNAEPFQKMMGDRRYAHEACYLKKMEEDKAKAQEQPKPKPKPVASAPSKQKEPPQQDKEQLFAYIKELFGMDYVTPRIQRQIISFVNDYHFTYSGIYKTLVYFYHEQGNPIDKSNGAIGIVPWVYDEAKEYYFKIYKAQQENMDKDVTQYIPQKREIIIPNPCATTGRKRKFSFLDKEE